MNLTVSFSVIATSVPSASSKTNPSPIVSVFVAAIVMPPSAFAIDILDPAVNVATAGPDDPPIKS